jgi:hypothetical protein
VLAWGLLGACASSSPPNTDDDAANGRSDLRSDRRLSGSDLRLDDLVQAREAARLEEASAPPDRAVDGPAAPLQATRVLVHLHSAYSHDACDGKGIVGGKLNTTCLKELRAAVCSAHVGAALLTDHPSFMSSYTMQEDLLFDAGAGDQLILENGQPIANRIPCPGGGSALLMVGFESSPHGTPLGLEALPADPDLYLGVTDSVDPVVLKQRVQGLRALGAVTAVVHSEEADLSVKTILDGGFEAMEWYNLHANITALIGPDLLSFNIANIPQLVVAVGKLIQLKDFLSGATGGPHPDLAYLVLLDVAPEQGIVKWQQAQATRPLRGFLGSDIHQNVAIDGSVCAGLAGLACQAALGLAEGALGQPIPAPVKNLLLQGGPILLADGVRLDGYARLMRWLDNRVLVPTVGVQEIKEALREGRTFGVFSVFGDPQGFSFTAEGQGGPLVMGESAAGPLTLKVRAPDRPCDPGLGGAPFSAADAAKAELRTRLLRLEASGPVLVEESLSPGALIERTVTQPGAYAVEIWIRPRHLNAALGTLPSLADREYRWVMSNPIYLAP